MSVPAPAPPIDPKLLEFVRALARAAAREDHARAVAKQGERAK